jgi:tetratricopeptide (TPR) repeat protein
MKTGETPIYDLAFRLKNEARTQEAIVEFQRLLDTGDDPERIAPLMIAMLYFHDLDDHESALPYAKQAVTLKPENEMASLCLVHCLFRSDKKDEIRSEIERYLKTGGKVNRYQTLFEENGVSAKDFVN